MHTNESRIVQLIPTTENISALFDAAAFGSQAMPFNERKTLIFWALMDNGHEQFIEGVIIDATNRLSFARNSEGFIGYAYPDRL